MFALAAATPFSMAGQANGPFEVIVNYNAASAAANSAYCTTTNGQGSFGAKVTVVCATGSLVDLTTPPQASGAPRVPTHGGAYRYVTQMSRAGDGYGSIDVFSMTGTVTSWRTVNLQDRSYTEMTVSW
jgi:hypothetical protein